MRRSRRKGSSAGLVAVLLLGTVAAFAGQVRVIAPSVPGSGWDQIAQALKQGMAALSTGPGTSVLNLPGGSGTVGLSQFAGSTSNDELLVAGLTMLDAALLNRSPVTLDRLTPVARLVSEPFALVVPAGSPLRSVDDLRNAMASGPGKVTWAGGPVGSLDHVAAILFARAVGLEAAHLNYVSFLTSAEAANAAGEEKVAAAILPVSEIQPVIAENRILVLGVTAPARIAALPAPTLTEAGVPLVFANWRGVLARSGLPDPDRMRLEALVAQAVGSAPWRALQERKGWGDALLGSEAFGAVIRDDQIRVKEALKAAGILKRQPD